MLIILLLWKRSGGRGEGGEWLEGKAENAFPLLNLFLCFFFFSGSVVTNRTLIPADISQLWFSLYVWPILIALYRKAKFFRQQDYPQETFWKNHEENYRWVNYRLIKNIWWGFFSVQRPNTRKKKERREKSALRWNEVGNCSQRDGIAELDG